MKYNCFKKLLTNNPNIIGKGSVSFRRFINPILRKASANQGLYNFHIERKAELPKDKRLIITPTHGFKDDIMYTIRITDTHSYILFGNLPEFFNSFNGISAWANGVVLVDRTDRENRKSSQPKMERVMEFGSNMIICPEARWNHSPNVLVQKLFPGTYDLAENTGALVVPVGFHIDGDNCYAILDEPFDITKYSREEGMRVLRDKMATLKWELMEKYSKYNREDIAEGKNLDLEWERYIESLINQTRFFDAEAEEYFYYRDKGEVSEAEVFSILDNVKATKENAKVLALTKNKKKTLY